MKNQKSNKGITLIALVITIIILLILAGLTLTFVLGENGLFTKARQAKEQTETAQAEEDINLKILEAATLNKGVPTKEKFLEALDNASDRYSVSLTQTSTLTSGSLTSANQLTGEYFYVTNLDKYPNIHVKVKSDFTIESQVSTASSGSSNLGNNSSSQEGENPILTSTLATVTAVNYGDYIDLGTSILSVSETSVLSDGNAIQGDWRIFYKDDTNVYAILSSYLPNENSVITSAGLATNISYKYSVSATGNRWNLIKGLDPETDSAWNSLIPSQLKQKGVKAKGAIDFETWIKSWNQKHSNTTLYISTVEHGYKVGTTSNTSDSANVASNEGYSDTLYFPYKEAISNCEGYWVASPWGYNSSMVSEIDYYGSIGFDTYSSTGMGVRPVVVLPINISVTSTTDAITEETTWTVN